MLDPTKEDVDAIIVAEKTGGLGVDVVFEMAGHPDAIRIAFDIIRRGGRIRCSDSPSKPIPLNFSEDIIFKGITIQGINGRRMYQTWYQMAALLKSGRLDLHPVITDRISMKDFSQAMARLKTGRQAKYWCTQTECGSRSGSIFSFLTGRNLGRHPDAPRFHQRGEGSPVERFKMRRAGRSLAWFLF